MSSLPYRKPAMDLSTRDLQRALAIRRQIDELQRRLNNLASGRSSGRGGASISRTHRTTRRSLSAAARSKIAAAARARWARVRAGRSRSQTAKKGGRRRGGITAAGRRRLSQLMKARWAARRRAQSKK